MIYTDPLGAKYIGDDPNPIYKNAARLVAGNLRNDINLSGNKYGIRRFRMPDNTYITATYNNGQMFVEIDTTYKVPKKGLDLEEPRTGEIFVYPVTAEDPYGYGEPFNSYWGTRIQDNTSAYPAVDKKPYSSIILPDNYKRNDPIVEVAERNIEAEGGEYYWQNNAKNLRVVWTNTGYQKYLVWINGIQLEEKISDDEFKLYEYNRRNFGIASYIVDDVTYYYLRSSSFYWFSDARLFIERDEDDPSIIIRVYTDNSQYHQTFRLTGINTGNSDGLRPPYGEWDGTGKKFIALFNNERPAGSKDNVGIGADAPNAVEFYYSAFTVDASEREPSTLTKVLVEDIRDSYEITAVEGTTDVTYTNEDLDQWADLVDPENPIDAKIKSFEISYTLLLHICFDDNNKVVATYAKAFMEYFADSTNSTIVAGNWTTVGNPRTYRTDCKYWEEGSEDYTDTFQPQAALLAEAIEQGETTSATFSIIVEYLDGQNLFSDTYALATYKNIGGINYVTNNEFLQTFLEGDMRWCSSFGTERGEWPDGALGYGNPWMHFSAYKGASTTIKFWPGPPTAESMLGMGNPNALFEADMDAARRNAGFADEGSVKKYNGTVYLYNYYDYHPVKGYLIKTKMFGSEELSERRYLSSEEIEITTNIYDIMNDQEESFKLGPRHCRDTINDQAYYWTLSNLVEHLEFNSASFYNTAFNLVYYTWTNQSIFKSTSGFESNSLKSPEEFGIISFRQQDRYDVTYNSDWEAYTDYLLHEYKIFSFEGNTDTILNLGPLNKPALQMDDDTSVGNTQYKLINDRLRILVK